ncbi:MAG TPA: molecular chaperone DnaK [Methylophaga aminisulfidivorans]|uniref:TraR/DksA C4-type zinc finger protein n=1 Tax=Methylophaga TaxID=40222 RepID=UPI00177942C6|nr:MULTISPECIES: TraR/DksA C4-type zinc finger protein [Methylophaga]HIC45125.1 molecular chaperone DnaK [Methylophaga sp.]HIM39840.1 molecular chaperone DnaK [Methylophaga aminisulfidivorans]
MDEKALLAMDQADYMNAEQLAFFDARLLELRQETLDEIEASKVDINDERVSDVSDRATLEDEAQLALRLAVRKRQLIPKIDKARQRIRQGDYGYCIESGEPIGIARLLIRPTAEYSTDIKNINEKRERRYEDKR